MAVIIGNSNVGENRHDIYIYVCYLRLTQQKSLFYNRTLEE